MKKRIWIVLIALLLIGKCFAANEVCLAYAVGNNLYFRIFDSTGKVYNTDPNAFETWADPNVGDYDISLTGTGGSFYMGTFPDLDDGAYTVVAYLRAGAAPAVSDGVISAGLMNWEADAEKDVVSTLADIAMPSTRAGRQP